MGVWVSYGMTRFFCHSVGNRNPHSKIRNRIIEPQICDYFTTKGRKATKDFLKPFVAFCFSIDNQLFMKIAKIPVHPTWIGQMKAIFLTPFTNDFFCKWNCMN
jgi:hypothetical protein